MQPSFDSLADSKLVELARNGRDDAFAELWRRHAEAGRKYARSITRADDSDDIVSEAFANILSLIRRGKGPANGFRAYLAVAIRHISENLGRVRRETPIDFADDLPDDRTREEHQLRDLDRSLAATAFKSLPPRWQEALWYSEVEQLGNAECAQIFGIAPSAMAMLTFRAREGLRAAWVQAHIADVPEGSEHHWSIKRLGAHSRRSLPRTHRERLESHLGECERCSTVAEESRFVGSRLALVLLGPLIGVGAAVTFLSLPGGTGTAVAAAVPPVLTMPPAGPLRRVLRWRPSLESTAPFAIAAAVGASVVAAVALGPSQPEAASRVTAPSASATSRSAPAPSPGAPPGSSPAVDDVLTVKADTGRQGLFYPVLSGQSPPNASVRVLQGERVLAELTASESGAWSTGQISPTGTAPLTVVATAPETDPETLRRTVELSLRAPDVHVVAAAGNVTVTIRGEAGAPFTLRSDGEGVAAARLGSDGAWSSVYPAGALDASALVARYQAGKRFGPPSAG